MDSDYHEAGRIPPWRVVPRWRERLSRILNDEITRAGKVCCARAVQSAGNECSLAGIDARQRAARPDQGFRFAPPDHRVAAANRPPFVADCLGSHPEHRNCQGAAVVRYLFIHVGKPDGLAKGAGEIIIFIFLNG